MKLYKNAIILGKFMPLHKGHCDLIDFALNLSDTVTIIIDKFSNPAIPISLRKEILSHQYGKYTNVSIHSLPNDTPQHPSEHTHFWKFWKTTLQPFIKAQHCNTCIVASELYGNNLAKELNIDFVPFDIDRHKAISATQFRNDPLKNWNLLSESSKLYLSKKIVFMGPESSGKTTLSKRISNELNLKFTPEYPALYIRDKNIKELTPQLVHSFIPLSNAYLETSLLDSSPFILQDTNYISTYIWFSLLFPDKPNPISLTEIPSFLKPNTIFLLPANTEWKADSHREFKDKEFLTSIRTKFYNTSKELAEELKIPLIEVPTLEDYLSKETFIKKNLNTIIKKQPF